MAAAEDAFDPETLREPLNEIARRYGELADQARAAGSPTLARALEEQGAAVLADLKRQYDRLVRRASN